MFLKADGLFEAPRVPEKLSFLDKNQLAAWERNRLLHARFLDHSLFERKTTKLPRNSWTRTFPESSAPGAALQRTAAKAPAPGQEATNIPGAARGSSAPANELLSLVPPTRTTGATILGNQQLTGAFSFLEQAEAELGLDEEVDVSSDSRTSSGDSMLEIARAAAGAAAEENFTMEGTSDGICQKGVYFFLLTFGLPGMEPPGSGSGPGYHHTAQGQTMAYVRFKFTEDLQAYVVS